MSEKKKALVILTPGFAKDEQDTTCIPFLQEFVTALLKLHPEIALHILAFQYPYKEGAYKWHEASVYSAGGKDSGFPWRLLAWKKIMIQLKKIYNEYDIIALHSFWLTEAALLGQRFVNKYRLRHIAYVIGQDALKKNRYLSLFNLPKMQLVATSDGVVKTFKETTGISIPTIIPAGLNINRLVIKDIPRTIDIIGAGALTELKNYSLFIDVIDELKKENPDIRAVIVGKGEQEQMLKEKVKMLHLESNIKLVGEVPHDEVFTYMNKSKVFLHTSGYEGQSTVILEALAMGLKVVCFDVGKINSDKIRICHNKKEMVKNINTLLKEKSEYKPEIIWTTDDMVKQFYKIYLQQ